MTALVFLPCFIDLLANYVTVVEDRPIMSAEYCLPVPVFHFWPKLTHPAAQSFSALEVLTTMRYINRHFTYLLYLLSAIAELLVTLPLASVTL